MAFTVPIFDGTPNAEQCNADILATNFHPDRSRNVEMTARDFVMPSSKVFLPLCLMGAKFVLFGQLFVKKFTFRI